MNRFITFEGIEGSGKTTQVRLAAEFLSSHGVDHVVTREPGGTALGDRIRSFLLSPGSRDMAPMAELLLIGAARVQHVEEVILPALEEGKVVLCDRFEDSTRAYQGSGRQLPANAITMISSLTAADLKPDLTFLFDLQPEEGLDRARRRNDSDGPGAGSNETRIDNEAIEFHRRVREGYLELARESPGRFRVIHVTDGPDKVARRVDRALSLYLKLT